MRGMKKYLFIYALAATVVAGATVVSLADRNREVQRLKYNNGVMCDSIEFYRTRLDESAASAAVLQLRCREFAEQHRDDARRIRDLGIRLHRVESAAKSSVVTEVEVRTVVRDTIVLYDTVRLFRWADEWVTVEGRIGNGDVECRVQSVDTLRQIVHRVPRRFWFIRYGTKAIRQEIVSSNPHSRIVGTEYIEFAGRRRRR